MNARDLGGGTAPFLRENEAFDLFVTIFSCNKIKRI